MLSALRYGIIFFFPMCLASLDSIRYHICFDLIINEHIITQAKASVPTSAIISSTCIFVTLNTLLAREEFGILKCREDITPLTRHQRTVLNVLVNLEFVLHYDTSHSARADGGSNTTNPDVMKPLFSATRPEGGRPLAAAARACA